MTSVSESPTPSPASPALFKPLTFGPSSSLTLTHRVLLAPLTRFRASATNVPTPLTKLYYTQRAQSIPGTLLITEGAYVAARAAEVGHVPGIWTDEQVRGWKEVAESVHDVGGVLFMQVWAPGRAGFLGIAAGREKEKEAGGVFEYVSSSAVALNGTTAGGDAHPVPRALSVEEIREYVKLFGEAAHNAVHGAGLDGVEIHAAHGYLLDQFLQDTCNKRTDEYGGSVENRCRFVLEVVDEAVRRVGAERVGIRISPWGRFQDMCMTDPIPTYTHLVSTIARKHPHFAYIHVPEPRVSGANDRSASEAPELIPFESNDFLRQIWASGPGAEKRVYITVGGYTPQTAVEEAERAEREGRRELVAFGRWFIANPDLPLRIKHGIPLTPYNRSKFYAPEDPKGYIDYPFADIPSEDQGNNEPKGARYTQSETKLFSAALTSKLESGSAVTVQVCTGGPQACCT